MFDEDVEEDDEEEDDEDDDEEVLNGEWAIIDVAAAAEIEFDVDDEIVHVDDEDEVDEDDEHGDSDAGLVFVKLPRFDGFVTLFIAVCWWFWLCWFEDILSSCCWLEYIDSLLNEIEKRCLLYFCFDTF